MAEHRVWNLAASGAPSSTGCPGANYVTSPCLSFPFYTRRVIIVLTGLFWDSDEIMLSKCLCSAGCFKVSA